MITEETENKQMTDCEAMDIIIGFARKMVEDSHPLDAEIVEAINDNFDKLFDDGK